MSRTAEAAQSGRYVAECTGSCLSRGCNCRLGHVHSSNLNRGEKNEHYPDSPGFKTGSTSREAAKAVAPGTGEVRERVFEAIAASAGGLTADEAAAIVGRKPAYVRPRVSELAKAGRIAGVGRRRNPDTGLSAKVWQIKEASNGAGR